MVSINYQLSLLRGIVDGEKAYTGPFFVTLDVTRKCNIHCVGCFFHCLQGRKSKPTNSSQHDLPIEIVKKLSQELKVMGTREIFLTGEGEPMLHPLLIEIIQAFKRAGFRVSLFTNGTLLTAQKADRLLDSGLDVLKISLWAVNAQEHRKCHPGVNPQLLEKRLEGLMYLGKAKKERNLSSPDINLHMIINQYNFKNISERAALAEVSGCNSVSFGVFRDYGGQFQELNLAPDDVALVKHEFLKAQQRLMSLSVDFNLDDYLPHANMGYHAWKRIPCYAGWFQAYIKVDGNVMLCPHCYRPVGDLKEQSFASIWNGSVHRELRRKGLAPAGLGFYGPDCDCANCCIIKDNLKVHRRFRWVMPLLDLQRSWKKSFKRNNRC